MEPGYLGSVEWNGTLEWNTGMGYLNAKTSYFIHSCTEISVGVPRRAKQVTCLAATMGYVEAHNELNNVRESPGAI